MSDIKTSPTAAAVADIKQRTTLPQIHKWIDQSWQKVQQSGGSGKLKYVEFDSKGDFSIEFKKTQKLALLKYPGPGLI